MLWNQSNFAKFPAADLPRQPTTHPLHITHGRGKSIFCLCLSDFFPRQLITGQVSQPLCLWLITSQFWKPPSIHNPWQRYYRDPIMVGHMINGWEIKKSRWLSPLIPTFATAGQKNLDWHRKMGTAGAKLTSAMWKNAKVHMPCICPSRVDVNCQLSHFYIGHLQSI